MSCYSPLHAFKAKSKSTDKISITFSRPQSWRGERLDLPCGQCVGCRLEKSRQWAVRCMHEASLHEENSFVTLTYDDKYIPANGSLVKSDFQRFMKRLRKFIAPRKVRYYHCGEYGENFGRPHYHALLFGYSSPDRRFFSKRADHTVYTSDSLSGLWKKGHVVEGDVSFESAAYVARYVMKKMTGAIKDAWYGERIPEYSTMSRRPGIGAGWFDRFSGDVYPLDRVVINGKETRPPRFYDGLYEKNNRADFAKIKIEREMNGNKFVEDFLSDGTRIRVSDNDGRRLLVREEVKKAEISALKRPLEGVI